ncbi:MAG: DUF4367 domain-containing protein [Clostridia bacterium]|nr:DUF4367 domain-containing protein [Clostridia bacterium]
MAMTRKEFADIVGRSFDEGLEAETGYKEQPEAEFSADFEKRMDEFFANQADGGKKKIKRRRWILVAVAAVLALAATACAVPEIRESIAGFFIRTFGDHEEYSDPRVTKERIEEEYDLVPVPEGYVCTYEARLEKDLQKNYTDDDGNIIQFSQSCADYISSSTDNEHGEFFEKEIGGKIVRIHYVHDVEGGYFGAFAAWVENGYYFELVYGCEIELEVFEQWVASVQIKP